MDPTQKKLKEAGGTDPLHVSLVTPTLNQRTYIRRTIESVLSQDYVHIDYHIVDGGSTDGTHALLREYEGRLRWSIERGARQSEAINLGWKKSRGGILAWINSDDLYHPGAIRAVVEFFHAEPEVDMIYGTCEYIDEFDQVIGPYPAKPFDLRELIRKGVNYIPQPAAFVRRTVVEQSGYLNPMLDYLMDFEYWIRVGLSHRVKYLDQTLAALRIHRSAKSLERLASFGDELVTMLIELFQRGGLPPEIQALEREAMTNAYYLAADGAFWAGDVARARRFALESVSIGRLSSPRGLPRLLALSLLGRTGRALAERWRPNPYLNPGSADS
jgi:glycosyltransferase involved in cell wall biosynthesis